MKQIVKVLAVALIVLATNALEARNLKILNNSISKYNELFVKQINIKGKDLSGKPTQATEIDLGSIAAGKPVIAKPSEPGSLEKKDVTNEPFTLRFKYPQSFLAGKEQIYTLDVQLGTQDGNKDVVIEVERFKGPKRVQ